MNTDGMATAPLSRAESKARTRAKILAAARRVFERRGFHGASLDQVAREAGFTKGAVYSAFDSKADLFFALLAERAAERRAQIEGVVGEGFEGEALVTEISRRFAQTVAAERDWWAVVIEFATVVARDEALRARYAEHHDAMREAIARAVETSAAANGDGTVLDPRAVATISIALNNGLTLESLLSPGEVPPSLYIEAQAALYRGTTEEAKR
jgi:AcrR family transcriptional regulator